MKLGTNLISKTKSSTWSIQDLLWKNGAHSFISFLIINLLFVASHIAILGYLNEDTVLINGAVAGINNDGFLRLFWTSYGPHVIRPFLLFGMYFEYSLFGFDPFFSHLITLFFVALAQTILFCALRPIIGIWGALFGVAYFAFSTGSGEPRFWLCVRHDIYLLLFFSCAILVVTKYLQGAARPTIKSIVWLIILSLCYWGAFYSNEKGSAAPAVICALATAWNVARSNQNGQRLLWKYWGILVAVSLLNTILYFCMRRAVLGELIGGYNSSILPPSGFSVTMIWNWMVAVFSNPFRQYSEDLFYASLRIAAPILIFCLGSVLFLRRSPIEALIRFVTTLCLIGALFLSSVPTLQYNFGFPSVGTASSRMFWFPLVMESILMGLLFGCTLRALKSRFMKGLAMLGFLLILAYGGYGGHEALVRYARASQYTRDVLSGYARYCACVDSSIDQVEGISQFPFGVIGYSERDWLFIQATINGMPKCAPGVPADERECSIIVRQSQTGAEIIPRRMSPSKLNALLKDIPKDLIGSRSRYLEFKVKTFPSAEDLQKNAEVCIAGWAREAKSKRPAELIVLLADDTALIATPPNVGRKEKTNFNIALSPSLLNPHTQRLRLVALSRPKSLEGKWISTVVAERIVAVHGYSRRQ